MVPTFKWGFVRSNFSLDIVGLSFVLLNTTLITLALTHQTDCLVTSKPY
jgi:hypothetical protein